MWLRFVLLVLLVALGCGSPPPPTTASAPSPELEPATKPEPVPHVFIVDCGKNPKSCQDVTAVRARLAEAHKACAANDQAACTEAAWAYHEGFDVPVDLPRSFEMMSTACDAKVGRACRQLAHWQLADPSPAAQQRVFDLFGRACELGDGNGCSNQAVFHGMGKVVPRDQVKGVALLTKGCDLDDGLGCVNLGSLHASQAPIDEDKAYALFAKACNLGEGRGCFHVADFTRAGRGTAADPESARKLFAKACELGVARACSER